MPFFATHPTLSAPDKNLLLYLHNLPRKFPFFSPSRRVHLDAAQSPQPAALSQAHSRRLHTYVTAQNGNEITTVPVLEAFQIHSSGEIRITLSPFIQNLLSRPWWERAIHSLATLTARKP